MSDIFRPEGCRRKDEPYSDAVVIWNESGYRCGWHPVEVVESYVPWDNPNRPNSISFKSFLHHLGCICIAWGIHVPPDRDCLQAT